MKHSSLKPSTKPLARKTPLRAHKPMARGSTRMRASKPASEKPKRAARKTGEDKLCRGQPCYLAIPGVCRGDIATVVPCHTNETGLGKGMGLKAPDILTVPGCHACHSELDQGTWLTKDERRTIWRSAYARWGPYREKEFGIPYTPLD